MTNYNEHSPTDMHLLVYTIESKTSLNTVKITDGSSRSLFSLSL